MPHVYIYFDRILRSDSHLLKKKKRSRITMETLETHEFIMYFLSSGKADIIFRLVDSGCYWINVGFYVFASIFFQSNDNHNARSLFILFAYSNRFARKKQHFSHWIDEARSNRIVDLKQFRCCFSINRNRRTLLAAAVVASSSKRQYQMRLCRKLHTLNRPKWIYYFVSYLVECKNQFNRFMNICLFSQPMQKKQTSSSNKLIKAQRSYTVLPQLDI